MTLQAEKSAQERPEVPRGVRIGAGECRVFFAYDIGMSIRLDEAQGLVGTGGQRKVVAHRRRTPEHFGYQHPPLRVTDQGAPIRFDVPSGGRGWSTAPQVECVLFEFGAVSVMYTIPLVPDGAADGLALADLVQLSSVLYENPALLADSKRRVEELLAHIRASVKKPSISALVEDYSVFCLRQVGCTGAMAEELLADGPTLASILRSEPGRLSAQEVEDALSVRICYGPDDLTLIDWAGALVVGADMEDVLAVLEYANVELLEMRFLDGELDRALEQARETFPSRGLRKFLGLGPVAARGSALQRIAELQIDAASLFEEVNNSLKMLGDQYLARVYRLASERLHLSEWDSSILRKLSTIESLYEKLHNFETTRRLELLEWIVIILIAFEVVMSLVRH
jgi:hypothetical protein